jgi:hypothetical protein
MMEIFIAERGMIGDAGNIVGIFRDAGSAEYQATCEMSEDTMQEVHRAPVQGHYTWVDGLRWGRVTGFDI